MLARLVEALVNGVTQEPPWASFLALLREAVGADYAAIVFRPLPLNSPQTRVVHLASGRQSPPLIAELYRASLYKEDPLPYFDLDEGRFYALDEILIAGDPTHEKWRQTFVEPSGMNVLRIVRVRESSGINAWLSVSRRNDAFSAQATSTLAAVVPLFRAAIANYVALERERTRAFVASEAIRRMNYGWLTLAENGLILDADHHADALLRKADVITRSREGFLSAKTAQLRRALKAALDAMQGGANRRPRAIVLSRDPWLDMLLVPAQLEDGATGPAPVSIAYVHAEHKRAADLCEDISQIFDLLPCEARLVLALSRGMTIAEAADFLGLTIASARTYTKRIYAKTGARGQTDLVRFVHRSIVTMA